MIHIVPFNDPLDFDTQRDINALYEGVAPFAAVMHQALTGIAGMWMYRALLDDGPTRSIGAGLLKSPEAIAPLGQDVRPIAWAVSDVVTHPAYRRRGAARALVKTMEGTAYANGGRILYLYADEQNEPACRLYGGCGFTRLASQSGHAVFAKLMGVVDGSD